MNKIELIIEDYSNNKLETYLESIKGINNVQINNNNNLDIIIEYNSKYINDKKIKDEIFSYLKIQDIPSLLSFNKHSANQLSKYKLTRNNICCEYCLKNAINDLFEIDGIKKVECNYNENEYLEKNLDDRVVNINILYDSTLLSKKDIKNIDSNISL